MGEEAEAEVVNEGRPARSAWYGPTCNRSASGCSDAFLLDENRETLLKGVSNLRGRRLGSPTRELVPKVGSLHFSPAEVTVGSLAVNIPRMRTADSFWEGAWSNRGNHGSGFINQRSLSFLNMNFSQGFWDPCREPDVQKRRNRWKQNWGANRS